MSDFNVKITVRNSRLLRRIRETFGSPAEMARQIGMKPQDISKLVTMRTTPFRKDGSIREGAAKVCAALRCHPQDLWPEQIRDVRIAKASREVELSSAAVEQIANAEAPVMQRMLLERWSEALTDRERVAVEAMRDGLTLDELGEELGGISYERARQIQFKALRKMREKARRDGILSYQEAAE